MGSSFPSSPVNGDYFLRTDFFPNRLFRYDGSKWMKYADNDRITLSNDIARNTYKTRFINETATNDIGGEDVPVRQSLSKALRPKADN
jgi:hypothetical protein